LLSSFFNTFLSLPIFLLFSGFSFCLFFFFHFFSFSYFSFFSIDPSSTEFPAAAGASRSGAGLKIECTTGNAACLGAGLWAVTG